MAELDIVVIVTESNRVTLAVAEHVAGDRASHESRTILRVHNELCPVFAVYVDVIDYGHGALALDT